MPIEERSSNKRRTEFAVAFAVRPFRRACEVAIWLLVSIRSAFVGTTCVAVATLVKEPLFTGLLIQP